MRATISMLIVLTLTSCSSPTDYLGKNAIDIHIENQTGSDLTNVTVFVVQTIPVQGTYRETRTDSSRIGTIAATKTATGTLYEKNIPGVDGSYLITVNGQNGKLYTSRFGYLTNGSFLNAEQYLIVQKDSIIQRP